MSEAGIGHRKAGGVRESVIFELWAKKLSTHPPIGPGGEWQPIPPCSLAKEQGCQGGLVPLGMSLQPVTATAIPARLWITVPPNGGGATTTIRLRSGNPCELTGVRVSSLKDYCARLEHRLRPTFCFCSSRAPVPGLQVLGLRKRRFTSLLSSLCS